MLGVLAATVNPSVGNVVLQQAEAALAEVYTSNLRSTIVQYIQKLHGPAPTLRVSQIEKVPGYLPTLLQIVANAEIAVELQHASVLRFKNLIHQHWRCGLLP